MHLFKFERWQLTVSEEAWGLKPFKAILDRDKSKDKEVATAEMLFIFYWSDIKSNYKTMNETDRLEELKKDITGLPKGWEPDEVVQAGIDLYTKHETVIEKLYRQTAKSASDIGDYLENTKDLLNERDVQGRPVTDINKITMSVQKVPKLMSDLKLAYKEVVKEQKDNEDKKKGSQKFNTFEDGFNDI